jgi:hypothetical protein
MPATKKRRLAGSCLCGAVVRNGGWVHVALGSLLDAPTLCPAAHIDVDSKAPY